MNKSVMPLISIIVPSFNEEKNISRCLDSILNSTYKNIEILCIDDNSTDSTYDIINSYVLKDSRIKAFKNPDKGVSSARNLGIKNATGEYIGFVDSDDYIQPQMYEFLQRAVLENNCDMVVCRYDKVSEFKEKRFEFSCRECECQEFIDFYDDDFVSKNELTVSAVWVKLIKSDYIKSINTFFDFKIGEDTVFCADLWTNTDKVFLVDLPLYCYFVNTQSVSFTKIWDEKWFDLIDTRFISYNIFKKYRNEKISSFYLEKGIKLLLSYRFNIKNSPNENAFKGKIKKMFRIYYPYYFKNKDISVKNKLAVIIFYFLPCLYAAYRKSNDSTL